MAATDPKTLETGVLALLKEAPADQVAAQLAVPIDELHAAVELYRAAGRTALHELADRDHWQQVLVDFTDWRTGEQIAVTRLGPALKRAETDGILTRWFFTRKASTWRLRCRSPDDTSDRLQASLGRVLNAMAEEGTIAGWRPGLYERESHAFGGPGGMEVAHELFHADSATILDHLARADTSTPIRQNRAELSVLLCGVLLRSAELDWYEQGDVWARVADHKPAPITSTSTVVGAGRHTPRAALRRLMTADTGPTSSLLTTGPLRPYRDWLAAFEHAGRTLRDLADDATLTRGLRAVLAQHVLFHWNRIGVPADIQGALAATARDIVLHGDASDDVTVSGPAAGSPTVRLHK